MVEPVQWVVEWAWQQLPVPPAEAASAPLAVAEALRFVVAAAPEIAEVLAVTRREVATEHLVEPMPVAVVAVEPVPVSSVLGQQKTQDA